MEVFQQILFYLVVAGGVVWFAARWLVGTKEAGVGTPTRLGMTKCTTCWKWSRSGRFDVASMAQDETLGTEALVTSRVCPRCGDLVLFSPVDEGSLLVVAVKKRLGMRCPNCGKLGWQSEFDNRAVSIDEGYLHRSMSGFSTRTLDHRHESCGYSWGEIYTHRENSGY